MMRYRIHHESLHSMPFATKEELVRFANAMDTETQEQWLVTKDEQWPLPISFLNEFVLEESNE